MGSCLYILGGDPRKGGSEGEKRGWKPFLLLSGGTLTKLASKVGRLLFAGGKVRGEETGGFLSL